MIFNRIAFGLSVAMVFAGVGCGGDDPLTATWSNTDCFGLASAPEGVKNCTTALTFTADLEFSLKTEQFSEPATADGPGCTTTRIVEGQTWSTDGETFTVEGAGSAMLERTGCVNASDNFGATATKDIAVPSEGSGYVITDNSLTIAEGALAGTYTY